MVALLVGRDDDLRRGYAESLRASSWVVERAADGREALARALALRPRLLITDARLPGISGVDLCGLLRRDSLTANITIFLIAADVCPSDLELAQVVGADMVLTKPCAPDLLAAEAGRLVSESPEQRQQRARDVRARAEADPGSTEAPGRSRNLPRKYNLKHTHKRGDTTTPPVAPPALLCPACERPLTYLRSHVGGVSIRHAEQWDYFGCGAGCGTFQHRARTRKLRKVP